MPQVYSAKKRQETASPLASPLPQVTEKQINAEDVQETFVNNKNMYVRLPFRIIY